MTCECGFVLLITIVVYVTKISRQIVHTGRKLRGRFPRLKTAENKLTIGGGAGKTCFSGLKLTTRERQSVKIQEL